MTPADALLAAMVARNVARAWRKLGDNESAVFWYVRARAWVRVARERAAQ